MNKLQKLRSYLLKTVPLLARNPDKLLVFAEQGDISNSPREEHLSFEYSYTATLVLTDFGADIDTVTVPIIAWLKKNQPDRGERKAMDFNAEILSNEEVDIEIRITLTEFVKVSDNGDDTVSTEHLGDPIYIGNFSETGDPIREWDIHNGE